MQKKPARKSKKQKDTEMAKKVKKVKKNGGERIGATPSRGAPKQKQSTGGKAKKGKR